MTALEFLGRVGIESWRLFVDSAPYLLFGFFSAGLLHGVISAETVGRHLGGRGIGPVVKAALFGVPLPLCSCGVLPAALGLRRKGASKGATLSFLVSTPETGVDSIALTYALMDPIMTIFRPIAAFVSAVAAGVCENAFGRDRAPAVQAGSSCRCGEAALPGSASLLTRLREGTRYAFVDLLGDLVPWLALGFLLAGLITVVLPPGFLASRLGGGWLARGTMLAVGIPIYICATASTPIAAALVLKGLSPGAALVFLLAGPATNLATLTSLTATLGPAATGRYVAAISVSALGLGYLLDGLYGALSISLRASAGSAPELLPAGVGLAAAALLGAAGLMAFLKNFRSGPGACPEAT